MTIPHRLATIRNADRIVVLGDGKIIGQGTCDGLCAANGAFRAMVPQFHIWNKFYIWNFDSLKYQVF